MEGKGRADQSEISCGGKGEAGRPLNSERGSEAERTFFGGVVVVVPFMGQRKEKSLFSQSSLSLIPLGVCWSLSLRPGWGQRRESQFHSRCAQKPINRRNLWAVRDGLHDQNGSLALSLGRREAAAVLLKDRVEIRAPMHASQFTHTENVLERRCQKSSTIVISR